MKTYRKGPFQVQIADDGVIKVKSGDWLSKYSAAIHNDFAHVHEYGRKDHLGMIKPVADVNRIVAGETLYHVPTYMEWMRRRNRQLRDPMSIYQVTTPKPTLTPSQKKKLIEELLGNEFNLRGANLEILSRAIDIVGKVDDALTLIEIAGLIGEGGVISAVGTTVSMASVILFPLGAMINLVDVSEINMRTAGMRAVAYSTTAWAFNENTPGTSQVIKNITTTYERERAQKAWNDASAETRNVLEREVVKRRVKKSNMQATIQAVGHGFRAEVCRVLLKSFEEELRGVPLESWKSNYKIDYPN